MKYLVLLILSFSVSKANANQGLRLKSSDPFQVIVDNIPEMQERLETCQRPERSVGFDDCLWNGDAQLGLERLDPEHKEKISQYLKLKEKDGREPELSQTPNQSVVHIESDQDPAIQKLQEYLRKRLRQALYGDVKNDLTKQVGQDLPDKRHQVVDHKVFYELYQNQVSQNIISGISSYCIEADPQALFTIPEDRDERNDVRKANLQSLSQTRLDPDSGEATIAGAGNWNACLTQLSEICYAEDKDAYCESNSECKEHYENSKSQACLVTRSIRGARQALIANQKIMKRYDEINQASPSIRLENSNDQQVKVTEYDRTNEKTSIDRISSFSSGEMLNKENEYNQANQDKLERLRECYENGEIKDPEACSEFLSDNKEEDYKALAEASLRTRAVQEQINNMESEEEVRAFLEKEGHGDEMDLLLEKSGGFESLRAEINDRYDAERQALIDEMASQIEDRSISGQEFDAVNDKDKIQNIYEELTDKENHFQELLHYNNIVSGFLTVNIDGESSTNSAVISREMQNSAFNPEVDEEGRTTASMGQDYFEKLNEGLEQTRIQESAQGEGFATLQVMDINSKILRYKNSPTKEDLEQLQ